MSTIIASEMQKGAIVNNIKLQQLESKLIHFILDIRSQILNKCNKYAAPFFKEILRLS